MFIIKGGVIIKPFNILTISKLCINNLPNWEKELSNIENAINYGGKWKKPFINGVKTYLKGSSIDDVKKHISQMNYESDVIESNIKSFEYFLEFLKSNNIDKNDLKLSSFRYPVEEDLDIICNNVLVDNKNKKIYFINTSKTPFNKKQIDYLLSFLIEISINNGFETKNVIFLNLKDTNGDINIFQKTIKSYKKNFKEVIKTANFYKKQIEQFKKADMYDKLYSEYNEDSDDESAASF